MAMCGRDKVMLGEGVEKRDRPDGVQEGDRVKKNWTV